MRHRSVLFTLIILSTFLLCLMLSGCKSTGEQPGTEGETTSATDEVKAPEPPPPPREATLAAGTPIPITISATLSTKTNKSGESFQASLNQDIVDGDCVVAQRGALVTGLITNSDPGGRVKGVASIALRLKTLELADGRVASIETNTYTAAANTTKKKDATKVGVGSGVGAAIGAIAGGGKGAAIGAGIGGAAGTTAVLATRGDPAVIRSEAGITFKLSAPLVVVEQK